MVRDLHAISDKKKYLPNVSDSGKFNFHVYCIWEMFFESRKKGKAISNLELSIQRQQLKRNSEMGKMLLKMTKVILQIILSIFIGDLTTALASILVNLVFN